MPSEQAQPKPNLTDGVTDPVCGMSVQPYKAAAHHQHEGKSYYFCCSGCCDKFRANPSQYLQPQSGKPSSTLAWLRRVFLGEKN